MAASIKVNFIYNVSITIASYIFGLIVFPYVSRCLGVELIGKTSYVTHIVSLFSLVALLGVSAVGTREIAKCGDDREKRSVVYSSIIALITITTVICSILLIASTFLIPQFSDYKELLLIGTIYLFFLSFQIEWFYQGIENFKYVATRSLIVRVLYCVAIFLFVHDKHDYVVYFIISVFQFGVNSIINVVYANKFVDFSLKKVNLRMFLKPMFSLGINKILISLYTTFNVLYLGWVCSDTEVGYYSTSIKIFQTRI